MRGLNSPNKKFCFVSVSQTRRCIENLRGRQIRSSLKTDINKHKQHWPRDVIKKNSMSRPHKTKTYCYFEAAGVIACEH